MWLTSERKIAYIGGGSFQDVNCLIFHNLLCLDKKFSKSNFQFCISEITLLIIFFQIICLIGPYLSPTLFQNSLNPKYHLPFSQLSSPYPSRHQHPISSTLPNMLLFLLSPISKNHQGPKQYQYTVVYPPPQALYFLLLLFLLLLIIYHQSPSLFNILKFKYKPFSSSHNSNSQSFAFWHKYHFSLSLPNHFTHINFYHAPFRNSHLLCEIFYQLPQTSTSINSFITKLNLSISCFSFPCKPWTSTIFALKPPNHKLSLPFFFYYNIIKKICQISIQNLTNEKIFSIIFLELRKKGVNT